MTINQPVHHCLLNENGITYHHVFIPVSHHDLNTIDFNGNENVTKFSSCFVAFHSLFLMFLGIAQIVSQSYIYYWGAGVWSGLFTVLTSLIALLLSILFFLILFFKINYSVLILKIKFATKRI